MTTAPSTEQIRQRRAAFRRLHDSGCFVIPNPWDAGSARYLASLGFAALASTSSGFAWSRGQRDGAVALPVVLDYLRTLVATTDLPVNADFEHGFADDALGVARNVALAIATGVAGISIEDSTGNPAAPQFALDEAVERMRAARAAIDASGEDVMLIGRAENFFVGNPDLADTIERLCAYAEAGADCLYAPALHTAEQIRAVVQAVAPKPVNVLVGGASAFTQAELAALGVRRISVGGGMARAAWGALDRAARRLAEEGRFDGFEGAMPGRDLNQLFG
ncbi:isocitrate lyase/phosphoenolpyruvate mutase family protein [Comamonas faecalis]|uniref:isocitrate lyase/phosphoenolpyruvate mutase family protein n=1 Tax=Comamonas faecalis TaxID=1387849 RepID=UPI000C9F8C30